MEKKAEKNMELKLMVFAIQDDEKFAIEHFGPINPVDDSLIEEALKLGFKESFAYSYSQAAKALLNWEEKDSGKSIVGGFRILNLDHILKKLSISNFDPKYYDDDDPILDFYVVDEFCNEAGVGIYAGKSATNSLYYFAIDERPEYLGLDFSGYMAMLIASRCFMYWQKAILSIRNKTENAETVKFKEHMPRLFSGWTWEEFIAKYESVKIEEDAF